MFVEHMHIYVGCGMSQNPEKHPCNLASWWIAPAAAAGGKLSDRKTVSSIGGQQEIRTDRARFSWYLRRIQFPRGFEPRLMVVSGKCRFAARKKRRISTHTPPVRCKMHLCRGNSWSHSLHVSTNLRILEALYKSILCGFWKSKEHSNGEYYPQIVVISWWSTIKLNLIHKQIDLWGENSL